MNYLKSESREGPLVVKIMLVDLSKIEIKTIIEALQFQMVESESLDDFNDKVNEEVGFKLYQLINK